MATKHCASTCRFVLICMLSSLTWHYTKGRSLDLPAPETNQLLVSKAQLNFTFREPNTQTVVKESEFGRYAVVSPIHHVSGKLVHVLTEDGGNHGCHPLVNAPQNEQWIALIRRGGCKFHDKVLNAVVSNASAVIVYNYLDENDLLVMNHYLDNVVSVFIHKHHGDHLASLVDSGVTVQADISLEEIVTYDILDTVTGQDTERYKVQPLLIISVSLIACLITALTALLIYGIRRTKAQHKKARRNIAFTTPDSNLHQRLLFTDHNILETSIIEPNNNDPNHNVYPAQS